MDSIYHDIGERTGGNIYVGVVGPVRTGKSTLIKTLMEKLVIPGISDPYRRERARDELPHSGSGRTIMTAEPKFIPEEAAEVSPDGKTRLRVRFIDTVGYMIPGAVGATEDGEPRMVTTPWFDHEIPMTQAAELGTRRVMEEHATVGLVVTTDGTVTDIPMEDYLEAGMQAVEDMAKTGKPFLIIINSREPSGPAARSLAKTLLEQTGREALIADCQALDDGGIQRLLLALLRTFPMKELRVHLPRWLDALEEDHPVKQQLYQALLDRAGAIDSLGRAEEILPGLEALEIVEGSSLKAMDLASGTVSCTLVLQPRLYYEILSARAGLPIENEAQLLGLLMELARVKQEYDQIADALSAVKATGYGVVMPSAEEMKLQPPELVRKGGSYGVKLKAGASSIHMVRVDLDTEISPMVGDEKQSRELIGKLSAEDIQTLWQSNIFGKTVYDLIQEGLSTKLVRMNDEVRDKFRGTLTRIVNEGATGLICLIL